MNLLRDGQATRHSSGPILSVNGKKLAEGKIPKTQPFVFSGDEGADVGLDGETNVSNDYKQGNNAFTGKITKVTVSVK